MSAGAFVELAIPVFSDAFSGLGGRWRAFSERHAEAVGALDSKALMTAVRLRNSVVHEAILPTEDEATDAVATLWQIFDVVGRICDDPPSILDLDEGDDRCERGQCESLDWPGAPALSIGDISTVLSALEEPGLDPRDARRWQFRLDRAARRLQLRARAAVGVRMGWPDALTRDADIRDRIWSLAVALRFAATQQCEIARDPIADTDEAALCQTCERDESALAAAGADGAKCSRELRLALDKALAQLGAESGTPEEAGDLLGIRIARHKRLNKVLNRRVVVEASKQAAAAVAGITPTEPLSNVTAWVTLRQVEDLACRCNREDEFRVAMQSMEDTPELSSFWGRDAAYARHDTESFSARDSIQLHGVFSPAGTIHDRPKCPGEACTLPSSSAWTGTVAGVVSLLECAAVEYAAAQSPELPGVRLQAARAVQAAQISKATRPRVRVGSWHPWDIDHHVRELVLDLAGLCTYGDSRVILAHPSITLTLNFGAR